MKKRPPQALPRMTIRLPLELHEDIADAAKRAGHSMNAEIVQRLAQAPTEITLADVSRQNVKTQKMLQQLIDALC